MPWSRKKYYMLLLVIPIVQSLAHGVEVTHYFTYNNNFFELFNLKEYLSSDPGLQIYFQDTPWLVKIIARRYWHLFKTPALYLGLSVLVKYCIACLMFAANARLLNNAKNALFVTFLILLSIGYESHGIVENGVFKGVVFYMASISSLFSLLGLYLFLRRNLLFSSMAFGMSILFHGGYASVFLAYVFPGMLLVLLSNKRNFILHFCLLMSFIVVSYASILAFREVFIFSGEQVSVVDWINYASLWNKNQFYISSPLIIGGSVIVPLLSIAVYFVATKKSLSEADFFFIGSLAALSMFFAFDVTSYFGLSFGALSELVHIIGAWRSLWVLLWFGVLVIVARLADECDSNLWMRTSSLMLLLLGVFCYLTPSIAASFFFLVASLLVTRSKAIIIALAAFLVWILVYCNSIGIQQYPVFSFRQMSNFAFVVFATSFVFLANKIFKKFNLSTVFFMAFAVFIFVSILFGLINKNVFSQLAKISPNGYWNIPQYSVLAKNVNSNHLDSNLLNSLHEGNPAHARVLAPVLTDDMSSFISQSGIVLLQSTPYFSYFDRFSCFSRQMYSYYLEKLLDYGFSDPKAILLNECASNKKLLNAIDAKYDSLDPGRIRFLADKYDIKFFIARKKYDDFELIYSGGKYYLYRL